MKPDWRVGARAVSLPSAMNTLKSGMVGMVVYLC